MTKWTEDELRIATTIVKLAPSLMDGFDATAKALNKTTIAVQRQYERGKLGKIAPKCKNDEVESFRRRTELESEREKNRRLVTQLAATEDELRAFKQLDREPSTVVIPAATHTKQRQGVPILLFSDAHVEEVVRPDQVNGLNEYNPEIAAKCIDRLADGYEWMLRDSRFDCRTGVIWLGGDLMTNTIHPELLESNAMSPQDTQVWLLDHLEAFFSKVLAITNLERIIVPCNSGNHARATDKQRVSTRERNSHEQVVYQTLARLFRNDPRLEFQIATGEWNLVDVMGFKLAFTHGDSFNYGGGVGGISIPIRRGIARQFQGESIHQFCMGHFHTRQDFGDIQINGSLIGYSAYSQRIHAPPEPRQQSWFMIDSKRGKCLSAPIWV